MRRRQKEVEIDESQILTVEEASKVLGKNYSRSSIMRRISSGEWEEGVHWFDDRREGGRRRQIRINLLEIRKLRSVPAGMR